jgi:hypothetical protein
VQAGDSDSPACAFHFDFQPARRGQRQFVHRNLIALGQIGIKVVLSGEPRFFLHFEMQRQRGAQRQIQRAVIQHRQRARQAQAYRTRILIGRVAEARRAAAKGLGQRLELRVDFQPDHRFVAERTSGANAVDSCVVRAIIR